MFSPCSVSCGSGFKIRRRTCDNPVPDYGGRDCERLGPSFERLVCAREPCPVHGGYTPWSNFSECFPICGNGSTKYRTRNCSNPEPQYGGDNCSVIGPAIETIDCPLIHCPVDGNY